RARRRRRCSSRVRYGEVPRWYGVGSGRENAECGHDEGHSQSPPQEQGSRRRADKEGRDRPNAPDGLRIDAAGQTEIGDEAREGHGDKGGRRETGDEKLLPGRGPKTHRQREQDDHSILTILEGSRISIESDRRDRRHEQQRGFARGADAEPATPIRAGG